MVVVSDSTPLHYLVIIDCDSVLHKLYGEIIVPPAVLQELMHSAAPPKISGWAKSPPPWLTVRAPQSIPLDFDALDFGERQALALAREIHADLVLLDDKVARRRAEQECLKVKGTLGVVADAAKAGLLNFRETIGLLQRTTMHLDPKLLQRIIEAYETELPKGLGDRP